MKFKISLVIILVLEIGACTRRKGSTEKPVCAGASCEVKVVDCRMDGSCPSEPDCRTQACQPIEGPCPDKGFEEAATIRQHPIRAAFCLNFAKEKKCKSTQDFLVTCMTLAGDIDSATYREHLKELDGTYSFQLQP